MGEEKLDAEELRYLADVLRSESDGDHLLEDAAEDLEDAADRIEELEKRVEEKGEVAAIAEDLLVGSRLERDYNSRLEEAGYMGDDDS